MLPSPPNSPTGLHRYIGPDIQRRHRPRPLSPSSRLNRPSRLSSAVARPRPIPHSECAALPSTCPFPRFRPLEVSDAGRCPCGNVRDGRHLKTFTTPDGRIAARFRTYSMTSSERASSIRGMVNRSDFQQHLNATQNPVFSANALQFLDRRPRREIRARQGLVRLIAWEH
jgi:hypothetical protein